MIGTAVLMGIASVIAALVTTARVIGWAAILKYKTLIDVAFTIGLGIVFYGTLTGMLVAVLGGLFMAITLTCLSKIVDASGSLRSAAARRPAWVCPEGEDATEYDESGNWIYNEFPYMRNGKL